MRYCAFLTVMWVVVAFVAGCGGGGQSGGDSWVTPSGLEIRDVDVGNGPQVDVGSNVTVHYTGWLTTGFKFDSSVERDEPVQFRIGASDPIKGWHEGIRGMRVGGKRRLIIPPSLAYGPDGYPAAGIPGNATLVFDIQLVALEPELWEVTETGLQYVDISIGTGISPHYPSSGLSVHYTGWLEDGTKFDSSVDRGEPFYFTFGRIPPEVIVGWEEGLETMKVGGKRLMIIPQHLAYGPEGRPPTIPPYATLIFEVELLDVQG